MKPKMYCFIAYSTRFGFETQCAAEITCDRDISDPSQSIAIDPSAEIDNK